MLSLDRGSNKCRISKDIIESCAFRVSGIGIGLGEDGMLPLLFRLTSVLIESLNKVCVSSGSTIWVKPGTVYRPPSYLLSARLFDYS